MPLVPRQTLFEGTATSNVTSTFNSIHLAYVVARCFVAAERLSFPFR